MTGDSLSNPDLSEYCRNSVGLLSVFTIGGEFGVTSPSWQSVAGWTLEDLAGNDFIEFVHPDGVERTLAESAAEWSEDSHTHSGFENRLRCRDGSYRWIEWTSQRRGDS
jgi:PAS domain S-box-containing protein